MKIGILTQPLHINYGGLLQNYALQTILVRMGHDAITFNIQKPQRPWLRELISKFGRIIKKILAPQFSYKIYPTTLAQDAVIRQNTNKFIHQYIRCTIPIHKIEDFIICAENEHFDGYVVGSDQVWRPCYNNFIKSMFLDFVEDKNAKKVAYAASFGTSEWEFNKKLTNYCAKLAKNFNLVTVREASGVYLCKHYLGVKATHVLDPTMLLEKKDYEKLVIKEKEIFHKGNLFHYFLDPTDEKKELIDFVAQKRGFEPFTVLPKYQPQQRTKAILDNHINDCIYPSVTSWLQAFMDAEIVIGDSYHCAVFSIIFNKPFWVVANNNRGNARFESLLQKFHLEDRMVQLNSYVCIDWEKSVDWTIVNRIWNDERKRCLNLLRNSLLL